MNNVEIRIELEEPPPWLPEYEEFCYNVLDHMKIKDWEVSVVLCSDPFIQDLNNTYRDNNEPTDVLSFPQDDPSGQAGIAGDIVISVDSVMRNAERFGISEYEELKRVYVHGVLHLKGMDHLTNDAAEPMLRLQEETLHAIMGDESL